jgi:hypothetical protein
LLTFLIEKYNKEFNIFASGADASSKTGGGDSMSGGKKANKLKFQIANHIKALLNEFWLPSCVKFNSLRLNKEAEYIREGCRGLSGAYRTIHLAIPSKIASSKIKYTQG